MRLTRIEPNYVNRGKEVYEGGWRGKDKRREGNQVNIMQYSAKCCNMNGAQYNTYSVLPLRGRRSGKKMTSFLAPLVVFLCIKSFSL